MTFKRKLFTTLTLILTSFSMSKDPKVVDIIYPKPSPCHILEKYSVKGSSLRVFLKHDGNKLCAQVIVKEKLKLPRDTANQVKRVEVFVGGRLWQSFDL